MTTAVEDVSSAVRRYVASVSGGVAAVPEVFDALARYVVGGLEPGETVLRAACLRNPRPDGTTAAAITVLTDRAVLLAQEGVPGQRIALADLTGVRGADVDHGAAHYPAIDLSHQGVHTRLAAAPVEGSNYELSRAELQAFITAVTSAAPAAAPQQLPAAEPQAVSPPPSPPHSYLAAEAAPAATSGATASAEYGKARFVGDAAPVGGIPLSRLFNSICYVIAGIALVVMSQLAGFPGGGSMALAIVVGLAAIAYGAKIALTRTSYWVSSWVYVLAFGSVAAMFGFLSH